MKSILSSGDWRRCFRLRAYEPWAHNELRAPDPSEPLPADPSEPLPCPFSASLDSVFARSHSAKNSLSLTFLGSQRRLKNAFESDGKELRL